MFSPLRRNFGNLLLHLRTVRYIPLSQMAALFAHRLKSRLRKAVPGFYSASLRRRIEAEWPAVSIRREFEQRPGQFTSRLEDQEESFRAFGRGYLRVLNRNLVFPPGRLWDLTQDTPLPPLVEETLHYHEFLAGFSLLLGREAHEQVRAVIEQEIGTWMRLHPLGLGTAWNPFTTAFRIRSWLTVHSQLRRSGDPESAALVRSLEGSLFEHGIHLERNLETHLGGNHLLKDLCGLAMLAGFFDGPAARRWLQVAQRNLNRQIEIQILPDGGHYERSPMYHILVLSDLLDAAGALLVVDPVWVQRSLSGPIRKMCVFLQGICHPDGDIPLLNDSVLGQAPTPSLIIERARQVLETIGTPLIETPAGLTAEDGVTTFPDTGLTRIQRGELTVIFDHGRLGPDELMGHVHNDTLSFELSLGKDRFIVDRGVYEYTPGETRMECRSIRAHNTPAVDDCEQAEIWASFRVAGRWHIQETWCKQEGEAWLAGGVWERPGVARIEREIQALPRGVFLVRDRIEGSGKHRVRIPLHFAPGVGVRVASGDQVERKDWKWEATKGTKTLTGSFLTSQPSRLLCEPSTCWPRFYEEEDTQKLVLSVETDLPFEVEMRIAAQVHG
jgi:hypothetical protein